MKLFSSSSVVKNCILIAIVLMLTPLSSLLRYGTVSAQSIDEITVSTPSIKNKTAPISPNGNQITKEKLIQEKVRRGVIESMSNERDSFTLVEETSLLLVNITASTSLFTGEDGMEYSGNLDSGMKVYVYGYLTEGGSSIIATKILLANKSKLTRK